MKRTILSTLAFVATPRTLAFVMLMMLGLISARPPLARAQDMEALIDHRVANLAKQLDLTEQQRDKARTIYREAYVDIIDGLDSQSQDTGKRAVTPRERSQQIQKDLDAILTPKQQKKYSQLKREAIDWLMQTNIEDLTAKLTLNETQVKQVAAALDGMGGYVNNLRQDLESEEAMSVRKRRTVHQLQGAMERMDSEIEAALDDAQDKIYQGLREQRYQKIYEMMEGAGQPKEASQDEKTKTP